MDPITRQAIAAAAGGAGGASGPPYVDDVFSTFLYKGTSSSSQTITNNIDLSGEGGLVWIKNRDATDENTLIDTERGNTKYLMSHSSSGQGNNSAQITSFNSNGFSLGAANQVNRSANDFVSWSFRKAPGFFDVVTYTGNGVAGRTVSHNLGSVPGFIIVKRYSATEDWTCYHRSIGANYYLQLNSTYNKVYDTRPWNNTAPTSSVFTVGAHDRVNTNGQDYVAYVFAHDDQSFGTNENESIIKCGSYTGSGANGNFVSLGFEPQWLLIKNTTTSSQNWVLFDVMRGMGWDAGFRLIPNTTGAEGTQNAVRPHATGFTLTGDQQTTNNSGATFAYVAIRRPNKPLTAATDMFNATTYTGNQTARAVGGNSNRLDLGFLLDRDATSTSYSTYGPYAFSRLLGAISLSTASSSAEVGGWNNYFDLDVNKGLSVGATSYQNRTGTDYVLHTFTRAPGFCDVVAYEGTGSAGSFSHNLEATPQLLIIKKTSAVDSWIVYTTAIDSSMDYMYLNSTTAKGNSSSGLPTSTVFNLSGGDQVNGSGRRYIAYLFASLSGISKVGTYSGTGYAVNVDCGFTNGARFVLIKRTDSSGSWYVWDTARGIVSGNDPYVTLNSTAAEVTNTDYIDPLNAGFTVTSSAPSDLNASGGTYLFLAIA